MEHTFYLRSLKDVLRARRINYSELSEKLKMTESGVKKMLNAKDISFRRILQICEVLDVLPGQLFAATECNSIPVLHLSEKQEDALINNRMLLKIYWLFAIEKLSLDEIKNRHKVDSIVLKKALLRLSALELISQKRGKFTPQVHGKFRWPENSKLVKTLNFEWSQLTLKNALNSKEDGSHRLISMKLSKNSYETFAKQILRIFDETVRVSEREELTNPAQELIDVTALFAIMNKSVFDGSD